MVVVVVEVAVPVVVVVGTALVPVEVLVVAAVDVDVSGAVAVPVVVVVVVSDPELPQAVNEATSAKLATAKATVCLFKVIKLKRLLLPNVSFALSAFDCVEREAN